MDASNIMDFARSSILVLLEIIAPAMITALVVGLVIGLLQALTQIQEQTLVFVPKIVAVFIVLLIALPFAGAALERVDDRHRRPHRRLLAGFYGLSLRYLRPVFSFAT